MIDHLWERYLKGLGDGFRECAPELCGGIDVRSSKKAALGTLPYLHPIRASRSRNRVEIRISSEPALALPFCNIRTCSRTRYIELGVQN